MPTRPHKAARHTLFQRSYLREAEQSSASIQLPHCAYDTKVHRVKPSRAAYHIPRCKDSHFHSFSWGHNDDRGYPQVTQLYSEKHSSLDPRAHRALPDHSGRTGVLTPPPGPLWNPSWGGHSLHLCGWRQGVLPIGSQPTFLSLWPLCHTPYPPNPAPRRGSLTMESCFSCTFAEMGNKRIKRTHWGEMTSGLSCWGNADDGIMSLKKMIEPWNSCRGQCSR